MAEIDNYHAVLLQLLLVIGLAATMLGLSVLVGRAGRRNAIKDSAYECGMLPIGDSQPRFSVKFYLVAMLFVLFDIEVVFMYPWAVVFRDLVAQNAMVFWGMLSFVGILTVAYVYALKKGALRWDN
jgi:NADH-quinone oxidoreductase subunit A